LQFVLDDASSSSNIIVAPKCIIDDLSKSIRYRQLVTDNRFDGDINDGGIGDYGHQHIIEVLKYCRSVLKNGRRVAKVATITQQQEENYE
jgi:hypothetical protein